MAPLPLTKRPLDLLYVAFFILHVPCSLLMDFQALYPPQLVPSWMSNILPWYLELTGDPVTAGGAGLYGRRLDTLWLTSLFYIELTVQFPCFFIGAWAVWKERRAWYPLLVAYGASTLTTMVPVLTYLASYPSGKVKSPKFETITEAQRTLVIGSMIPWVVIPAMITVDFAWRASRVLSSVDRAAASKKAR